MRCQSCDGINPAGARYCNQCGHRLADVCPACNQELAPDALTCGACGRPVSFHTARGAEPAAPIDYTPRYLADRILTAQAEVETSGIFTAERKIVSAVFADLVDSTALIHNLDPEAAQRVIDPVLALMMESVHHYGGYVAKSLGDGILALFGAPLACEDHAQRALYAGLKMQRAMRDYAREKRLQSGPLLRIRVGINSGEVVMRFVRGADLRVDYEPVGQTIHLASRLEGVAAPGEILVSESTFRLADGFFDFRPVGPTQLKGIPGASCVYAVAGVGSLRTRLQVAAHRGLARFVGRDKELAYLRNALLAAAGGQGKMLGLAGEPGIGKSRLFHEFKQHARGKARILEAFSVSHGKAFAYLPLIDLLRNYFQLSATDSDSRQEGRIRAQLTELEFPLEPGLSTFVHLLGIGQPDPGLLRMDPELRRRRTFESICQLLLLESRRQPLVLIFEDLQWLDPESEAFISFMAASIECAPVLLLLNYRNSYLPPWDNSLEYPEVHLDPLGPEEGGELFEALLGKHQSLDPLRRQVLDRVEGNPLFLEEVVHNLIEEGVLVGQQGAYRMLHSPTELNMPATVQAVLAARIDRLPPDAKVLLQSLAVIGRAFPLSLIAEVVGEAESSLQGRLVSLQAGGFLYEQPAYPEVEFYFKHGLTQQVVYGSLLSEARKRLHGLTARAIETLYREALEDHYGDLAYHYTQAGDALKALDYLELAGQQALQRCAISEAVQYLESALGLLDNLPDSPARASRELNLRLVLGPALVACKGYAASEVEDNYNRAMKLCRTAGDTPQLFPVLLGLDVFYIVRGKLSITRELGERLISLGRTLGDTASLVQAHLILGSTLFHQGALEPTLAHLQKALGLHRGNPAGHAASLYGLDPEVVSLPVIARVLWHLGYPAQALLPSEEALVVARDRGSPYELAYALVMAAELHLHCRDVPLARQYAEAAVVLATEQGYPYWLAWGKILQGWAMVEEGDAENCIAQMTLGLAAYRETGAELWQPHFLALLAQAHGRLEQPEEGLRMLDEAFGLMAKTGERIYEAELHRLRGELRLLIPASRKSEGRSLAEVERHFRTAIRVAQKQGARSLELRAATSLARLLLDQRRPADARQVLGVYATFTEGFDMKDLQDAQILVAQL